jgi:hypothetical protein
MTVVGGLDVQREQIRFDYVDHHRVGAKLGTATPPLVRRATGVLNTAKGLCKSLRPHTCVTCSR